MEIPTEKDDLTQWGYNSLQREPIVEEPVVYTPSEMSLEQEQFFTSFFNPIVNSTQEDCITNVSNVDIESDMLLMDAWEEQPTPVEVSQRLSAKADSRIVEQKVGEQLWVVEVVGEEQGYLHVSDGSARAWVEAVAYGTFDKGDILSILVERTIENHVFARAVDILQKNSTDFAIEEDNYHFTGINDELEQIA